MRKNALLALLALFVPIALVAAGCGDDDDSGDDTEQTDAADESTDDSNDESSDDSEDDGGAPDDEDAMVRLFAENLASGGQIPEDDAECMAQYIVDEIGFDELIEAGFTAENAGEEPPEELAAAFQQAALDAISECDVTLPTG